MDFNLEHLRELIAILNQTDIAELTLESGDLRLSIRKSETKVVPIAAVTQPVAEPISSEPMAIATPSAGALNPVVATTVASPTPVEPPSNKKMLEVTSPIVGTFYRAPAPDDPPFVDVADTIKKGQTVCIIEAMKLMNTIETEFTGRIIEILVENGQPVEYGQVLMRLEPV